MLREKCYGANQTRLSLDIPALESFKYNQGISVLRSQCSVERDKTSRGGKWTRLIVSGDVSGEGDIVIGLFQVAKSDPLSCSDDAILAEYSSSGAGTALLVALPEGGWLKRENKTYVVREGLLVDISAELRASKASAL